MNRIIYITGVSGSGKSTIGKLLATILRIPFKDGDDFHPSSNKEKMASGTPLSDVDRWPWLESIAQDAYQMLSEGGAIYACSALKKSYRDLLCKGLDNYLFIHLQGSIETITSRLHTRQGHFMPRSLLQSQFDTYEVPSDGLMVDINQGQEAIIAQILNFMNKKSQLGLIGLGVMGTSLARNMARNGFDLSLYNRHVPESEENVAVRHTQRFSELSHSLPFDDLHLFCQSLSSPKCIMLMVNAGKAVDDVISVLLPYLEAGDNIIDAGNSWYKDTERRYQELKEIGIEYLGIGVSGGEEGALYGPSIMPGGALTGYRRVEKILTTIAAKNPMGQTCCRWVGNGGAGHFVKMVHNGIEYAEMQLIAEVYGIMRYDLQWNIKQIVRTFTEWSQNGDKSYLLDITIDILETRKEDGGLVLDDILDKSSNKGTGAWTTQSATELGVAIPTITEALFARYISADKDRRIQHSQAFLDKAKHIELSGEDLRQVLYFTRYINHVQGLRLIEVASKAYGWNVDLSSLTQIWSGGCIIKSDLLPELNESLATTTAPSLLLTPKFLTFIAHNLDNIKRTVSQIVSGTWPAPCILSTLPYFQAYMQKDGGGSMIQAQRDYFGAHTFYWKSDPQNAVHYPWTQNK